MADHQTVLIEDCRMAQLAENDGILHLVDVGRVHDADGEKPVRPFGHHMKDLAPVNGADAREVDVAPALGMGHAQLADFLEAGLGHRCLSRHHDRARRRVGIVEQHHAQQIEGRQKLRAARVGLGKIQTVDLGPEDGGDPLDIFVQAQRQVLGDDEVLLLGHGQFGLIKRAVIPQLRHRHGDRDREQDDRRDLRSDRQAGGRCRTKPRCEGRMRC